MWDAETRARIAAGELIECWATMQDGTKQPFLKVVETKRTGAWRGSGRKGFRDARLTPRSARLTLVSIEMEMERISGRKSATSATSAPVTRGDVFVMQEMARDGISEPLAIARLGGMVDCQGDMLLERQPGRFPGGAFDYAGQRMARDSVARWWAQPF